MKDTATSRKRKRAATAEQGAGLGYTTRNGPSATTAFQQTATKLTSVVGTGVALDSSQDVIAEVAVRNTALN